MAKNLKAIYLIRSSKGNIEYCVPNKLQMFKHIFFIKYIPFYEYKQKFKFLYLNKEKKTKKVVC